MELDSRYILRGCSAAGEPLPMVKGRGIYLWDASGRRYMDLAGGYFVNVVGHCHPRIAAVAAEQARRVTQVTMRQISLPAALLAEKLALITPGRLSKTLFATGGSEANEFALKLARCHTKRSDIIAIENSFHGLTLGSLAATWSEPYRLTAYQPLPSTTHFAPVPYCYRCDASYAHCDVRCARQLEQIILDNESSLSPIGSILIEPVQGAGGIIPPVGWFEALKDIVERHDLILIADEIQSGLGRTGAMFACEHWNLEPQIMTLGKGISGGIGSLGAIIADPAIVDDFKAGTVPTSAGNAVSCAAGLTLINVLEDEDICNHAARMGDHMIEKIKALDNPYIGDIRFKGLMGGVELVADRQTRVPLPKKTMEQVRIELLKRNMFTTTSGLLGNVIRCQPPLTIQAPEIDYFVSKLDKAIHAACRA